MPELEVGSIVSVYLTGVVNPDDFQCQLAKTSTTELPLLMDQIHDYCASTYDWPTDLQTGTVFHKVHEKIVFSFA